MHIVMTSYTVGKALELLLGEEGTDMEEDLELPLPIVDTDSEDEGRDEGI